MTPLIPEPRNGLDYLTLDQLEELAFEFRNQGASIVAVQGPSGPEWLLRVKVAGAEVLHRAHRPVVEVAS